MATLPSERRAGWRRALVVLLLLSWASGLAAEWQEYAARYAVYRNGKLIGKAEFSLQKQGDLWVSKSEGSGTHGLARILRARDNEYVEGHLRDGRFYPLKYTQHTRVAGVDNEWNAQFDWDHNAVKIVDGKNRLTLDLGAGALDALSLKLELQRRLRESEPELNFFLVDEDEIKEQQFRKLNKEMLETSLGCLQTIPVERVRSNSKRYTRAWHAPEFEFITVRLEHGKTGGDHMEMRITELVLGDRLVSPQPGCVAQQLSP